MKTRLGQIKSSVPSEAYIAAFPGFQSATDTTLADVSGNARHALFAGGLTASEAWTTNSTAFSTLDTTVPDDAYIPLASWPYSWNNGDSLVLACRTKITAPGSTRNLFAQGYHSTNSQGFRLIIKATGVVAPWVYQAGGDKFLSDTVPAVADGAYHSFMFAWFDHNVAAGTAKYMIWVDGVRAYASETVTTGLTTMTPVDDFRIGGNKTGASAWQSTAAAFQGIHMLRSASSKLWTYAALDDVALRLHRNPIRPLTATEFPAS